MRNLSAESLDIIRADKWLGAERIKQLEREHESRAIQKAELPRQMLLSDNLMAADER